MFPRYPRINGLRTKLDSAPVEYEVIRLSEFRIVLEPAPDHEWPNREQVEPFQNGKREENERPPKGPCRPCAEDRRTIVDDTRPDSRMAETEWGDRSRRVGFSFGKADHAPRP